MKKRPQAHRPTWPQPDAYRQNNRLSGVFTDYAPVVFGGAILIAAFAFAGHVIGRNAVAHNATIQQEEIQLLPLKSNVATKGSLLPEGSSFEIVNLKVARQQSVVIEGKGDLLFEEIVEESPPPLEKPSKKAIATLDGSVKIEPAALDLKSENNKAVKRLALTPKPSKIEKDFTLSKAEKQKVVAQRRVRLAEENCLARAVYFEARSESELGQMAVAKVILNRTRADGFPKSICGVVYQGSNRRNSCQFSFACDGQPDDVKQPASWANAKRIAKKAIAGETNMGKAMGNATNYHADYVKPKWSKTMRRLVKIGRHIFYADG